MIVLLDSGPLGLVTNPKQSQKADACKAWLARLVQDGHRALIPTITDYEVRRELRLYGKMNGLRALDRLKATAGFVSLSNAALLQAAEFWAQLRRVGLPTADRLALDADVILCAQAATLDPAAFGLSGASVIVATDNVGHLTRLIDARHWQNIS